MRIERVVVEVGDEMERPAHSPADIRLGAHLLVVDLFFGVDAAVHELRLLEDLLRLTVRLRPSRICLGELRGSETLTLLSAWNTDTRGGIATIHANTSRSALDRLELFVRLASNSVAEVARTLIGQAVHLVVSVHRGERGPQVAELLRVEGYDSQAGEYRLVYE